MLTVHHLGISQSERIVWLCEELDIPYRLVRYARDPATRLAPADYKALHPAGTAPIIMDGDLVLAESGAIIDCIIGVHGAGRLAVRADQQSYSEYLYWFHFANGSLMASWMVDRAVGLSGGTAGNATLAGLRARLDRAYDMIERRLGVADYFAGPRACRL